MESKPFGYDDTSVIEVKRRQKSEFLRYLELDDHLERIPQVKK